MSYFKKKRKIHYQQIDWSRTPPFKIEDIKDMVVPFDEAISNLIQMSFETDHNGISPYQYCETYYKWEGWR